MTGSLAGFNEEHGPPSPGPVQPVPKPTSPLDKVPVATAANETASFMTLFSAQNPPPAFPLGASRVGTFHESAPSAHPPPLEASTHVDDFFSSGRGVERGVAGSGEP